MDPVHILMDPVHGPGQRRGSMDQGSMFCTFPNKSIGIKKMVEKHHNMFPPCELRSHWLGLRCPANFQTAELSSIYITEPLPCTAKHDVRTSNFNIFVSVLFVANGRLLDNPQRNLLILATCCFRMHSSGVIMQMMNFCVSSLLLFFPASRGLSRRGKTRNYYSNIPTPSKLFGRLSSSRNP